MAFILNSLQDKDFDEIKNDLGWMRRKAQGNFG
jgi:hypothetical protein